MYFNLITALLITICIINSCYCIYYTVSQDKYNIAGSPMQFNITASDDVNPLNYRFDLEENVTNSSNSQIDRIRAIKYYIFPNNTKPGVYRLKVQVYLMFQMIKMFKVNGPSHVDFEIRDKMNGNIKYNQENLRKSAYKQSFVSCFNPIKFESQIDDFHNYYDQVIYNWYINSTLVPNATDNQLNYTLNSEAQYNITTTFNATSRNNLTTIGRNELHVTAFKPLTGLNLTGIPNIQWKRNKNLEIYVNFINGTKPFWYCYQIYLDNNTKLLCDDPDQTTQDYFKVLKRFTHNGTYFLKIKAGNMVTKVEKSFPISVIDFEKKSQMMFIIMPIIAFILILTILLTGILHYVSKRNRFITEIADFNFETRSQAEGQTEETFFQRLKKTFLDSIENLLARNKARSRFRKMENVNNLAEEETQAS